MMPLLLYVAPDTASTSGVCSLKISLITVLFAREKLLLVVAVGYRS
jgi:hypothetical protein